jgi:hypothetical protein
MQVKYRPPPDPGYSAPEHDNSDHDCQKSDKDQTMRESAMSPGVPIANAEPEPEHIEVRNDGTHDASQPDTVRDFGSIEARSDTEGRNRVGECRCHYSLVRILLYVTLSDVARVFLPPTPQSRQTRLRRYASRLTLGVQKKPPAVAVAQTFLAALIQLAFGDNPHQIPTAHGTSKVSSLHWFPALRKQIES